MQPSQKKKTPHQKIQSSLSYPTLIESWKEYIILEELSNLKIKVEAVKNFELYTLDSLGSIFHSEKSQLKLLFQSEDFLKNLSEKRDSQDIEQKKDFYLLFPLIEEYTTQESFYYPVFIIPFTEKVINFLKCDVQYEQAEPNKNIGICSEKYAQLKDEFSRNLYWFEKIINMADLQEYVVCKPVFTKIFKMGEDEYEQIPSQKTLLTFLREFLNSPDDVSFYDALNKFKKWIENRISGVNLKKYKVSYFDFLITTDISGHDISSAKIKQQLSLLADPAYIPTNSDTTAHSYLYGQQKYSFEEYNIPDDTIWSGTFHKFPLSSGQALLLQKLNKNENLIAAQGPPGTGKTTILMSIIADILTKRALSIAKNDIDYSTLVLIASTANKAVENAARDIMSDPQLQQNPICREGGYYFIGGRAENITNSISRLESIKKWLEEQDYSPRLNDRYKSVKDRLIIYHDKLNAKVLMIETLKKQWQSLVNNEDSLNSEYPDIEFALSALNEEIKNIEINLNENYQFHINKYTAEELKIILENYYRWHESYSKSGIQSLPFNVIEQLCDPIIEQDSVEIHIQLSNASFIEKITNIFTQTERKCISDFIVKHKDIIEKTGYKWENVSKKKYFISFIGQFIQIIRASKYYINSLFDKRFILYPIILKLIEEYISKKKHYSLLDKTLARKQQLLNKKQALENHILFPYIQRPNGVFDLWREKYCLKTRAMYILASEFLLIHAIKNKDEVIRSLELFIQLYSMQGGMRAKEEILQGRVEDFYRHVSLICPVHFSSLHSASYIYDKFIKNSNAGLQHIFSQSGFKPIHLLFIDEAGMALPHLAYPAIYWSEKVIAVGDPMQLEPVVSLDNNTIDIFHAKYYSNDYALRNKFSPALTSVYHRCARCETGNREPTNVGQACFLDYHRRCQKPIAELFCDIAGYRKLQVETPCLAGKDLQRLENMGGKNLIFYDVCGLPGHKKNTNIAEIIAIKAVLNKLKKAGYDITKDVGIITPFVNQEALLHKELKGLLTPKHIGTDDILRPLSYSYSGGFLDGTALS